MSVRCEESGGERYVVISGMDGERWLTTREATELRDGLTAALGAPQAMTDREAMVFAAAFAGYLHVGGSPDGAVRCACSAVSALRVAAGWPKGQHATLSIDEDTRAMLAAMTGGGK